MLAEHQIERDHLRRAVDAGTAVDVDLLLARQLLQHPHSALRLTHKVLVVHVLNRVPPELHSALLAQQSEVVRRQTVALEVALGLDRKDGCDALLFESLDVGEGFRVAADEDLGSYLRELQCVETTLVVDGDLAFGVSDAPALWMGSSLCLEVEEATWFSLPFHGLGLSDVIVTELLFVLLSIKRISENLTVF